MKRAQVTLEPLQPEDRERFILDNQEAFNYGAMEEFGFRDGHMEADGQIISREVIEASIDGEGAEAWRIVHEGRRLGGLVLQIDAAARRGELELLFVAPKAHGLGLGYGAWLAVEALHPEIDLWETCTPYFEKRNIHFYINKCGFAAVEFFNPRHPDPHDPEPEDADGFDGMFRFEKRIR